MTSTVYIKSNLNKYLPHRLFVAYEDLVLLAESTSYIVHSVKKGGRKIVTRLRRLLALLSPWKLSIDPRPDCVEYVAEKVAPKISCQCVS